MAVKKKKKKCGGPAGRDTASVEAMFDVYYYLCLLLALVGAAPRRENQFMVSDNIFCRMLRQTDE